MDIKKFIILEDNHNVSYIYSLLFSMFYNRSYTQDILTVDIYNNEGLYLQQLLNNLVFKYMRQDKIITNKQINTIKNYLYQINFKPFDKIIEEQSVIELYDFIMNLFECNYIYYTNDSGLKKKNSYIELLFDKNSNIKNMLINWQNNNKITLYELPKYITIHINRTNSNYECNINEYIRFTAGSFIYVYKINSLIYTTHLISPYYNCLLLINNGWYILSSNRNKILNNISIKDITFIRKTVEVIFYCLVDKLDIS